MIERNDRAAACDPLHGRAEGGDREAAASEGGDYKIISIGSSCFIATEMRVIGQRYEAMPFDYIETNLYLINEFFIDPERSFESLYGRWSRNEPLESYKGNGFVHPKFPHHTPGQKDFEYFKRAYERLKNALNNDKIKILFIHINSPYYDRYNCTVPICQIESLRDIKNSLIKYYPNLKFSLALYAFIKPSMNIFVFSL